MTPQHRAPLCISAVLVFIMAAFVVALAYFMLFQRPFLTYKNLPFPTKTAQVHAGQSVPLTVERCNSDDVPHNYNTTHALENVATHTFYVLPAVPVIISPGCTISESRVNVIPLNIPPGRYRVFGMAEVPGTFRMFSVEWYSEHFEVIP